MKKYAKIINEETKACEVGVGTNSAFYQSIGMTEMEVELAYDGNWYVAGYAPEKLAPTYEEVKATRASLYASKVDTLMAKYTRKKTFNLFEDGEEAELLAKIEAKVAEIKENNPYPVEEITPNDSENNELDKENIIEEIGEDKKSEELTSE